MPKSTYLALNHRPLIGDWLVIAVSIVAVIVIIAALVLVATKKGNEERGINQNPKATTQNDSNNTPVDELTLDEDRKLDDATVQPDQPSSITSGLYVAYNDANFSQAVARKDKIVLFFHAAWCPACRAVEAEINGNANVIPPGITVLKVDYDNSQALKKKYGVVIQHTFVQVDAQGNKIVSWNGGTAAAITTRVK